MKDQINASLKTSLLHCRIDPAENQKRYIDSFLLDFPLTKTDDPVKAWNYLEAHVPYEIRVLGVSNIKLSILERLYREATIKPSVVMNAVDALADEQSLTREFCKDKGIRYQMYWSVTDIHSVSGVPTISKLAEAVDVQPLCAFVALIYDHEDVVFRPSEDIRKTLEGIAKVREWALVNTLQWEEWRMAFRQATEFKEGAIGVRRENARLEKN